MIVTIGRFNCFMKPHRKFRCFLCLLMHDFGDGIQNLAIASAAAGGAVGYFLNMFECFLYVCEINIFMKGVFNVEKAYLLAVADHVVFHILPPKDINIMRYG